jgi:nucleoside 2-deoxyribosyltransferase
LRIYLAGPINGRTDEECNGWRSEASSALAAAGHETVDPMRRDYRGVEDTNVEAIVRGDLDDIASCDVVLVNANAASWGTAMELVYARQMGKTIVAFCSGPRVSPWLRYQSHAVVGTQSQAIETILSPSWISTR